MNMAFSGNAENYLDQRLWLLELEKCELFWLWLYGWVYDA